MAEAYRDLVSAKNHTSFHAQSIHTIQPDKVIYVAGMFATMRTVVLAGAGATAAAASSTKPPKRLRPPLDATFFEHATIAGYPALGRILNYIDEHHGYRPSTSTSTEEVFNYLFSDMHDSETEDAAGTALWALLRIYNRSIADTTNPLNGRQRRGVHGLVQRLQRTDKELELSFVTFNQDLMIEKALTRLASRKTDRRTNFSVRTCYGVPFESWKSVAGRKKLLPDEDEESIPVIKLHGSLNWVHSVRSIDDPGNVLREPHGDLTCITTERLHAELSWKRNKKRLKLVPTIVPPFYEKSSRMKKILQPLRREAADQLSNAERVVIFGYSFPDADFMAKSLIRRNLAPNKKLERLTVIDTDSKICERVLDATGADALHYASSVDKLQW